MINYDEMGKTGLVDFQLHLGAETIHLMGSERYGGLRGYFVGRRNGLRWADSSLNPDGIEFLREYLESSTALVGLTLSQMEMEGGDPMVPTMTWGKGKWPSMQAARFLAIGTMIYGMGFPFMTTIDSLFGLALQYADKAFNGASHTGDFETLSDPISTLAMEYLQAVEAGAKALPFTLYVPSGYGQIFGKQVPNVQETGDASRMLSVEFAGGVEVW